MVVALLTSSLGPLLARIFLPFVLLALGVTNAPAIRTAEDLNIKVVCSKCGHVDSARGSSVTALGHHDDESAYRQEKARPPILPNGNAINGAAHTNGSITTEYPPPGPPVAETDEVPSSAKAPATTRDAPALGAKPKPAKPTAPAAVEDPDESDDDDEQPTDDDLDFDASDDEEEEEDTALSKDVAYSKRGEGADPDGYNISSEMAVNLDDPKVQAEIRNAAMLDPAMKKELLAENPDQADKIREILGDDEDDDDDTDDDGPAEIEAEVEESELVADSTGAKVPSAATKVVKRKIPKARFLIATRAARVTLKKKLAQTQNDVVAMKRTSQPSKDRKFTTMTGADGKARFSMIMAVSQGYLNSQLMFRHAITPAMHNISVKLGNGAELNAALNAPQVSLHFDDGTASSAVYHMSFGAGVCQLWNGKELVKCDPAGWKYAFSVNLALQNLESNCPEAQEVAKNWGKPGDYSIRQLLIDLKSADLANDYPEYTKMGNFKHTKKTLASFKYLIMAWMQQAGASGGNVIGHSLTTDKPETVLGAGAAAGRSDVTIPTSQMLQTYPYIPKGETEAAEGLGGDADSNMLVFLNMTRGRDFPASKALAYSGNWCTPQIPGTLCIARQVLFDDLLLPLLAEVNRSTHLEPTRCQAHFDRLKSRVEFDVGRGSHPDSWFLFKTTDNPNHNAKWSAWEWVSKAEKQHQHKGRIKSLYCRGTIRTQVTNKVVPVPGTNRIAVTCRSVVWLESKVRGVAARQGNVTVVREGGFEIRVRSVADGNVELAIEGAEAGRSPLRFDIKTSHSKDGMALLSKNLFARIKEDMTGEVADSSDLAKMAKRIQESIGTVGTFVVPGGGEFFIEGAAFNNARDLMFETEYKASN